MQGEFELASPPQDGISKIRFANSNSNENILIASSWDTSVRVYDVGRNVLRTKYHHKAAVLGLCCIDMYRIFSGGLDRTVKLFEPANETETIIGEHEKAIKCLEWNTTENLLVTGSWDQTIKLWDLRSREKCIGTYAQPERVYTMDVVQNRLIVGTAARHLWIWDLRRMQEPEQRRESSLKYQTRCVKAYPDGTGFAMSSTEGRVAMEYFDPSPEVQSKKYAFKCHRGRTENGIDQAYPVNDLSFHPQFGTFASGGCDGYINIWDGRNRKRLCQFHQYPTSIASIDFSRDGNLMAIASSYTFEELDKQHPADAIFIRQVNVDEVKPKPRQ